MLTPPSSRTAAYEQPTMPELGADDLRLLKRNRAGWRFFESQPPGYRKRVIWWVAKAKQPATRERRLAALTLACAEARRL